MSTKLYETIKHKQVHLNLQKTLEWKTREDLSHPTILRMIPQKKYQSIKGFGAAFTESAAWAFHSLSDEKQKEILKLFFHPQQGNRYTFCRTHINSCDFSLENYSYVQPDDTSLESFTLEREKKSTIALIKAARKEAGRELTLFASPWSPPHWMKSNGEMNHGGELKEEHYETWARYFCRYIQEMEKEEIPVWGITVQNEPEAVQVWDSCIYTPEQERDFVRDYLGPELKKQGLEKIKIYVHDHNRDRLFERCRIMLADPKAAQYITGAALHWYCGGNFSNLEAFKECFPDKDLIFSEGTQEEGNHHRSWALGERYAHNIINDINRGVSAWVDWNLVLDLNGGPNHVYNLCSAPIMIDTQRNHYLIQNSYYYIGHFSRFLQPEARRILTTSTTEDLETIGFINPDESLVMVILNRTEKKIPYCIMLGEKFVSGEMEPRSIATLLTEGPGRGEIL